jgi:hypothetical protein
MHMKDHGFMQMLLFVRLEEVCEDVATILDFLFFLSKYDSGIEINGKGLTA